MKMRFKFAAMAMALASAVGFTACDNGDDGPGTPWEDTPEGRIEMWGETMRGDDQSIGAYPDIFAHYWEYTFDAKKNPNVGLRIEGIYPDARFFNYNVYDDITQSSERDDNSLMDVQIAPDAGSVNPFTTGSYVKDQKYTLYVLPRHTPDDVADGKANICWFESDLELVAVFLRYYIPRPVPFGSVMLPKIKAFDVTTGKDVKLPKRELSGIHGDFPLPGGAFADTEKLPFFRAPLSLFYPNRPAEYMYARNQLKKDEVITFNFKAPSVPADMRYWSVCVGNQETYSYLSIYDEETEIDVDGFANYVLADKNSANIDDIRSKCEEKGWNLLEWDRAKWGDGVMILYRNMVFADDYAHSIRKMEPVGAGTVIDPMKHIAAVVLGPWGGQGHKMTETVFLTTDVNPRQ